MVAFASVHDVEARWRPLSTDEQSRAWVLLGDASDMIRDEFPDIDVRLAADEVRAATLVRITAGMVKRAMSVGDREGVASAQDVAGPFSHALTFTNPDGNLYLSAKDRRALAGRTRGAFTVDLMPPLPGV